MSTLDTGYGKLRVRTFGVAPAPVVALHGFTLHGGMFATLAEVAGTAIAAPDLPGHGQSEIDPVTIETAVGAIAELLGQYTEPPLLLGYSQGGRVALHVAIQHPDLVGSLCLVATSPGLNERARRLRTIADNALATRIEEIGTERFIAEWLANALTTTDRLHSDIAAADRQIRLESTASGLADALRGFGQASVPDSRDQIATLPMPTAFVAGRRDDRFVSLAIEMAHIRGEQPVLVDGAGHNVILEAPEAVAEVIRGLLGRQTG
ncbi:MAG: alpha/beta fold hydrolase [bacterium]|nr:alpha/beta fold hydrolase [bacterium]